MRASEHVNVRVSAVLPNVRLLHPIKVLYFMTCCVIRPNYPLLETIYVPPQFQFAFPSLHFPFSFSSTYIFALVFNNL